MNVIETRYVLYVFCLLFNNIVCFLLDRVFFFRLGVPQTQRRRMNNIKQKLNEVLHLDDIKKGHI